MYIDRIIYPVKTLGPGNRLTIWTIGCPHHCMNCSNPELWDKDTQKDISVSDVAEIIKKKRDIDGITITGGDPFYQSAELLELVKEIRFAGIDDILIYTGYLYEHLMEDETSKEILRNIAALVDGPYISELNDNIGLRGSSNQRLFVFNKNYEEKYKYFESAKRQRQNFNYNGYVISVGIPNRVD